MKTNPSASSPWFRQGSDIDNITTANTPLPDTRATEVVEVTDRAALVAMRPRTLNVVRDRKNNDTKKFIRYVTYIIE